MTACNQRTATPAKRPNQGHADLYSHCTSGPNRLNRWHPEYEDDQHERDNRPLADKRPPEWGWGR